MSSSDATPAAATHELAVPGATVVYDVSGDLSDCMPGSPPLLVFGSPMDATGFGTLVGLMADRVVVTYDDPRNAGRSRPDEPTAAVPAGQHAADLHELVVALGGGPVDAFGTSGGAVNALLWVAAHPGDVRTLVAHERPLTALLPDRAQVQAVTDDMLAAYDAGHRVPAQRWRRTPRRARRLPGRGVRLAGQAGRVRRTAARGPRLRELSERSPQPVEGADEEEPGEPDGVVEAVRQHRRPHGAAPVAQHAEHRSGQG